MIISLTASADAYITNKIIDSVERTTSNTGKAGTLDLFSLHDESNKSGSHEVSRALVKFDINSVRQITSSMLNVDGMKAFLRLKSIVVGNPCPSNFTVSAFPLAIPFSEGVGRDVVSFTDLGVTNFLSASETSSWYMTGCMASGQSGSSGLDYYTSADFGNGLVNLESKQYFEVGNEDLLVDVTHAVSATIVDKMNNNGFRISFSSSDETSGTSLFVKRFATRHVKNHLLRPSLEIRFDDSRIDYCNSMFFDKESNVYLISKANNEYSNLIDVGGSEITGQNCLSVIASTASYTAVFSASQESLGGPTSGVYVVPILINSNDSGIVSGSSTLQQHIYASGSIDFLLTWNNQAGTKVFREQSLTIKSQEQTSSVSSRSRIVTRCDGPQEVEKNSSFFVRCLFYDISEEEAASKFPYERKPLSLTKVLYRIRDTQTGGLIYDFDRECTSLSLDSSGNYVNIHASSLPEGRPLMIEFEVNYGSVKRIIYDSNYVFKVKV